MNPTRAVFADTFYWIALFNERDGRHKEAIAFSQANTEQTVVTTDEVLTEFLAYFSGDPEARIGAAEADRRGGGERVGVVGFQREVGRGAFGSSVAVAV